MNHCGISWCVYCEGGNKGKQNILLQHIVKFFLPRPHLNLHKGIKTLLEKKDVFGIKISVPVYYCFPVL